jgi:hypothetical protein
MSISLPSPSRASFPLVLQPRYAWALQAFFWIPLITGLVILRSNPRLVPPLVWVAAVASLLRAFVLFSILLSPRARRVFVAAGASVAEHQRLLWATAVLSAFVFALAALQAVVMQRWVAP